MYLGHAINGRDGFRIVQEAIGDVSGNNLDIIIGGR